MKLCAANSGVSGFYAAEAYQITYVDSRCTQTTKGSRNLHIYCQLYPALISYAWLRDPAHALRSHVLVSSLP